MPTKTTTKPPRFAWLDREDADPVIMEYYDGVYNVAKPTEVIGIIDDTGAASTFVDWLNANLPEE